MNLWMALHCSCPHSSLDLSVSLGGGGGFSPAFLFSLSPPHTLEEAYFGGSCLPAPIPLKPPET